MTSHLAELVVSLGGPIQVTVSHANKMTHSFLCNAYTSSLFLFLSSGLRTL